jgi:hypothetical protein
MPPGCVMPRPHLANTGSGAGPVSEAALAVLAVGAGLVALSRLAFHRKPRGKRA